MPIKQNAKKALRQAKKRAARNLIVKKTYKDAMKVIQKAMTVGQEVNADMIRTAQQALDKAAKRGVLKQQNASRKLSRLMTRIASMKTAPKAETKPKARKPRASKKSA